MDDSRPLRGLVDEVKRRMKLEIRLKPEKAEEIRQALFDYIEECREAEEQGEAYLFLDHSPDEIRARLGYYDGEVVYYPRSDRVEYSTCSGLGYYELEGNILFFDGRRRSFLDGTMLFSIDEEDCESWKILESQAPERSPWR